MDGFDGLTGLAQVSAMLVTEEDLSGVVATGIAEAARAVGADGAGVLLVVPGRDDLDVLASTSHVDADLEAYQAAVLEGPCVETVRTQLPVAVASLDEAAAAMADLRGQDAGGRLRPRVLGPDALAGDRGGWPQPVLARARIGA